MEISNLRSNVVRKSLLATGILVGATLSLPVYSASVTYVLDQANTTPPFSDGTNYLTVTIDDEGGIGSSGDSIITFTVTPLGTLAQGSNFGIQSFGFNIADSTALSDTPSAEWTLPTGWDANVPAPPNNLDGFGRFDVALSDGGSARQDPLIFSIDIAGDSISSYLELSTSPGGTPAEGPVYFAAHVAGLDSGDPLITSAWFGGSTPVPIPPAVWLFGSGLIGLIGIARRKQV